MADTGAPYFIPYVEPTDLVRDYPAADEAQAEAVADALDAAGGLVAVKSAIFTGIQSDAVLAGDNLSVTDLTITHETADAANKLIISAFVGSAGSNNGRGNVGIALHDGTGLIGIGDAAGSRTRVTAGGFPTDAPAVAVSIGWAATFIHVPGAGSKTYTVRLVNISGATQTLFVNRGERNDDAAFVQRAASSLVIQEVKV